MWNRFFFWAHKVCNTAVKHKRTTDKVSTPSFPAKKAPTHDKELKKKKIKFCFFSFTTLDTNITFYQLSQPFA